MAVCRKCGAEFEPWHPNVSFCSNECKAEHRREYMRKYNDDNRPRIRELKRAWMRKYRAADCKESITNRIMAYEKDEEDKRDWNCAQVAQEPQRNGPP